MHSLRAVVTTHFTEHIAKEAVLELQRLIFNCPQLRLLSMTLILPLEGFWTCIPKSPPSSVAFDPEGMASFPPLRELRLDGYFVSSEEWHIWRKGLDWQKLTSLSLGRRPTGHFLDVMKDVVPNLRILKISIYDKGNPDMGIRVEKFLRSFETLEELVLDGFLVPVEAIAQHSKLMTLHMHIADALLAQRATLSRAQLEYLNRKCPRIENLRLDFNRDSEWVGGTPIRHRDHPG